MRNACRTLAGLSLAFGLLVVCAARARADATDDHLISARAGIVNAVAGDASVRRSGSDVWLTLRAKDELQSGDSVRTGAGGRVEVLLNPGSYLRLGESSEFELTDASLDTLRIKLAKGSAVVEAAGFDDGFAINVATPQTQASIVRGGIYRFDLAPNSTELSVRKGRALVGAERALLKGGMTARVGASGAVEVAKSEKRERDALEVWSKDRAEELARANRTLQLRQVNSWLASYRFNDPFFGSNFGGVWLLRGDCYTFMPFYGGWSSPYGFSYAAWLWLPFDTIASCGCRPRYFHFPHTLLEQSPFSPSTSFARVKPNDSTGAKPAPTFASHGDVKTLPGGGGGGFNKLPGDSKPPGDFKSPGDFSRPVVNTMPPASPSFHPAPPPGVSKSTAPRDN